MKNSQRYFESRAVNEGDVSDKQKVVWSLQDDEISLKTP
jgi:hypothetical protein